MAWTLWRHNSLPSTPVLRAERALETGALPERLRSVQVLDQDVCARVFKSHAVQMPHLCHTALTQSVDSLIATCNKEI